jgi:hypothetical protein
MSAETAGRVTIVDWQWDNRVLAAHGSLFPDVPGLGNVAVSRHAQARKGSL